MDDLCILVRITLPITGPRPAIGIDNCGLIRGYRASGCSRRSTPGHQPNQARLVRAIAAPGESLPNLSIVHSVRKPSLSVPCIRIPGMVNRKERRGHRGRRGSQPHPHPIIVVVVLLSVRDIVLLVHVITPNHFEEPISVP